MYAEIEEAIERLRQYRRTLPDNGLVSAAADLTVSDLDEIVRHIEVLHAIARVWDGQPPFDRY